MRHRNTGRQLGRTSSHRASLLRNLAISLIEHERIRTTVAKAKELRRVVEPVITLARRGDTLAHRRLAFDRLRNRPAVTKLFNDLGPHYRSRAGGYVRILRAGYRGGDHAPLALIQLVDRPEKIRPVRPRKVQEPASSPAPALPAVEPARKPKAQKAQKTASKASSKPEPVESTPLAKGETEKKKPKRSSIFRGRRNKKTDNP